jgi:hypothetical protein
MIQYIRRGVSKGSVCVITESHHPSIWNVQREEILQPESVRFRTRPSFLWIPIESMDSDDAICSKRSARDTRREVGVILDLEGFTQLSISSRIQDGKNHFEPQPRVQELRALPRARRVCHTTNAPIEITQNEERLSKQRKTWPDVSPLLNCSATIEPHQ